MIRKTISYSYIVILFSLLIPDTGYGRISGAIDSVVITKVNSLIDKIINESSFRLIPRNQKSSGELQIIDFKKNLEKCRDGYGYALSYFNSDHSGDINLGISFSAPVSIWVNGKLVFSQSSNNIFQFVEYAYDMYRFQEKIMLHCMKGENLILIKMHLSSISKIYLAAIDDKGQINNTIHFTLEKILKASEQKWLICGPIDSSEISGLKQFPVEDGYHPFYRNGDSIFSWDLPEKPLVLSIEIPEVASFKKHSYLEWHYATGALMWAVLNYADSRNDNTYRGFVKHFCESTLENLDVFRYQYESLNDIHGFNHRIFRMQMLDDASAPALPFMQMLLNGNLNGSEALVDHIADYVINKQLRLSDGTFCRPEPEAGTIWADDLFMSVPFLMVYGRFKGDALYYAEAAKQVKLFYQHLFNKEKGICYHARIQNHQETGFPYWARANGWMIWAISEALSGLPKGHPDRDVLLKLYRDHIKGLMTYQDSAGFLHQLLDQPGSFPETSATAMFTLALARGINRGWIEKKYERQALAGWNAVSSRIEDDGTVRGICEGTSVSNDPEYYLSRKMGDHDPRGLGAVITAGNEIYKMLSKSYLQEYEF